MFNTIINNGIAVTARAITTAQRNAEGMHTQGYRFEEDEIFTGSGKVTTPEGKEYFVHLPEVAPYVCRACGKCTCPYFEQNGVCKHIYFAQEEIQHVTNIAAYVDAEEAKEYATADRYAKY